MMSTLNKVRTMIQNYEESDILYKKWDIRHRDEYFSRVYWNQMPALEKYFFEANPSYFYEYQNMFDIGRYPLVMIRDGYVGILDFFFMHPVPTKDMPTIFMIPKKYKRLVPKKWKEQVVFYTIEENKKSEDTKKLLIVHGPGLEDVFWKRTPEDIVSDLANLSTEYKKVYLLLPQRDSFLSTPKEQRNLYWLQLIKNVYKHFGFDVQMSLEISAFLKKLESKKVLSNFSFINIDQNQVFNADNYIDHYLWSKGGHRIELEKENVLPNSDEVEYSLSPFHKIKISEYDVEESLFGEFYIIFKMMRKEGSSIYDIYQSRKFKELFIKYF